MPKSGKNASSSNGPAKKKRKNAASSNNAASARFVVCPYTDQKVFVAKATLQDLKELGASTAKGPKRLWTIASAQIRQGHYLQVAQAIAKVEQDLLPSYGGRSWEVAVTLSEPDGRVLFRRYRGRMELAVLPHLLGRIPGPPAWPGRRCGQPPDEYEAMQGEVAEALARRKQFHSEQEYIHHLTTREVSTLSTVAFEVLRGRPHSHPIPQVTTKWKSPDAKTFTSRRAAWEYAEVLSKQEVLISRNLSGVGASGRLLQAFTPSPKTTLEVGRLRFVRDGLWVVGQELAWQHDRPVELQAQQQEQEAQPKVYNSGLQLYVATHRHPFKEEHGVTLGDADKELRQRWRRLSPQEKQVWNDRVQDQLEGSSSSSSGEEEDAEDSDVIDDEEEVEYVSPLKFFVEKRRHDYRYERQMELNADKFTLAQADRELRAQWREMTEVERDEWIVKLGGEVEEEEDEKDDNDDDDDCERVETEEDESMQKEDDKANAGTTKNECSERDSAVVAYDHNITSEAETPTVNDDQGESSASSDPSLGAGDNNLESNIASGKSGGECEKFDGDSKQSSHLLQEKGEVAHKFEDMKVDVLKAAVAKRVSPSTVSDTAASGRSQRAQPPPSRVTGRWCMKPKQISLCHDACMEHYETVMRTVKNRDLARELADGFDVLRERGHGRFDMELPAFDTKDFDFLNDFKKTPWMPVVNAILGPEVVLIHKGCFLSLPGAGAQVYHQDGVHLNSQSQQPCHAINVFIPLVDLKTKNGPTEFCLGSHVLGHEGYDRDFLETPKPAAGTPVVFDYRLGHRGMANSSHSCRPIVYCTYARAADGKEFRDQVNFSRKRYHRIGELAAKPISREERREKRKRLVDSSEEADLQKALALSRRTSTAEAPCIAERAKTCKETAVCDETSAVTAETKKPKLDGLIVESKRQPVVSEVSEVYAVPVSSISGEMPLKSKVQDATVPIPGIWN